MNGNAHDPNALEHIYNRATYLEGRDAELTTLDLHSRDLDAAAATDALYKLVKPHHRSICIASNFVSDDAWKIFTLDNMAKIVSLDLSDNYISQEGVQLLAPYLAKNRTLTHLNLSKNHIQSAGASHIISAIAGNTVLQTLDLSGNNIDKPKQMQVTQQMARNRRQSLTE